MFLADPVICPLLSDSDNAELSGIASDLDPGEVAMHTLNDKARCFEFRGDGRDVEVLQPVVDRA